MGRTDDKEKERGTVTICGYQIDRQVYDFHVAMARRCAELDSHPEDIVPHADKEGAYRRMCVGLATGREMEWARHYPPIMINEFGKEEHIDSFRRRHPHFAEDIEDAIRNYEP